MNSYNPAIIEPATVDRLMTHLYTLLSAMVEDETQRIDGLPLLPAEERRLVLETFNETAVAYPEALLIHQLFERQAALRPEAVALVCQGVTLIYGELNRRTNQLAHYLIELGVKPDDRVALCVERSVDMIIGVLGILKAGGAYVPLDPDYPVGRLAYMLADSQWQC